MRTIKVNVKAKIGKLVIEKAFDYDEPESWSEAIRMAEANDGNEAEELKVYQIKRKTNFQDKKRNKMEKQMTQKIGALPKEKLIELGLVFDDEE